MRWHLAVVLAGLVLFGLPLLVINFGALGIQAKIEQALGMETSVPGAVADAGDGVLGIWGRFREGQEIGALFSTDNFTRRRTAACEAQVTINDVRVAGEGSPPPEYEEIWVLARAAQYALDDECPVILETIGRACAVSTATVGQGSTDGVYRIEAVVGYLPDQPLGSSAIDGPRDLYRSRLRLPARGAISVLPEGREAVKRSLYPEAERACRDVRETRGNCVMSDLRLYAARSGDDGTVPHYVTAHLYTVGPKGSARDRDDLVGSYGASLAENRTGIEQKLGLLGALSAMLAGGQTRAKRSDSPRIIRGGHQRYGGSNGRFMPARDR